MQLQNVTYLCQTMFLYDFILMISILLIVVIDINSRIDAHSSRSAITLSDHNVSRYGCSSGLPTQTQWNHLTRINLFNSFSVVPIARSLTRSLTHSLSLPFSFPPILIQHSNNSHQSTLHMWNGNFHSKIYNLLSVNTPLAYLVIFI